EYHAAPPPEWDGESALPVLLHFHGWGRRSSGVLKNQRVAGPSAANGVLLLAPQGLGRSWSFWSEDSRDSEFALAVIEDAATRWNIDRSRVFISGFSYGGAMAWRMACDKGAVAAKFLPIAGSLWSGDREDCAEPVALSHVHGLTDTVMDYPFGPNGEEDGAVSLWLRENHCGAEPDEVEVVDRFQCRRWTSCGGPPVELCTHPSGHFIPKTWLGYALPRALAESG
ncbi:MAG: polyhydroxybutyrate depolymerase, partial [Pseudomonadota bacterium]